MFVSRHLKFFCFFIFSSLACFVACLKDLSSASFCFLFICCFQANLFKMIYTTIFMQVTLLLKQPYKPHRIHPSHYSCVTWMQRKILLKSYLLFAHESIKLPKFFSTVQYSVFKVGHTLSIWRESP